MPITEEQFGEIKGLLDSLLMRFNKGESMIKHGEKIPVTSVEDIETEVLVQSKTFFEQFYLYESGTTRRLYVYVNATWIALSEVDASLYVKKDGTIAFTGDQSMGTHKLTDVVDPTDDQDAATKKYVDESGKFGGDGSDGDKTVSSDESLDFDSKNILIKQYNSLTIGAGHVLSATNVPAADGGIMYLKIKGNLTLNANAKIRMIAKGAQGGQNPGDNGFNGYGIYDWIDHHGKASDGTKKGGGGGGHQVAGSDGTDIDTGGVALLKFDEYVNQYRKGLFLVCGSGGGAGQTGGGPGGGIGGKGGIGGGIIYIEVGGNVSLAAGSKIDVSGQDGYDGETTLGEGAQGGGGGGGGSGGQIFILYNGSLTNNGTLVVSGGAGGTGSAGIGQADGDNGGAGGAGDAYIAKNTEIS